MERGERHDAVPAVRAPRRRRPAARARGHAADVRGGRGVQHRAPASGAWVFAGGLHPKESATTIRYRDGSTLVTDGPWSETKEQLGGFWVICAEDLDEALKIAERGARACMGDVEVRPLDLPGHLPFRATRAELLARSGRTTEAVAAYDRAVALCGNAVERQHLLRRRAVG